DQIVFTEVDASGRMRFAENFADHRLGDAIVRLYERHAESLPAGAERERIAATARSIAIVIASPIDPDRWPEALAPDLEFVDRRPFGYPRGRGAEAFLRAIRVYSTTGEVAVHRIDDILAQRADALLLHSTSSGT